MVSSGYGSPTRQALPTQPWNFARVGSPASVPPWPFGGLGSGAADVHSLVDVHGKGVQPTPPALLAYYDGLCRSSVIMGKTPRGARTTHTSSCQEGKHSDRTASMPASFATNSWLHGLKHHPTRASATKKKLFAASSISILCDCPVAHGCSPCRGTRESNPTGKSFHTRAAVVRKGNDPNRRVYTRKKKAGIICFAATVG